MAPKTIDDIIRRVRQNIKSESSIQLIIDAYEVAKAQHEGQFRKSNDPYIQHPLEVAYMLAELNTSPVTIASGLLHDVLEDTQMTKEEIKERFNEDVANIVDGVTKIGQLKYMTKEKALARSHQKILLAMAKDIRVVLVKLVDRVHNMRTLNHLPPEKQRKIAQETLDLYAPLAHRMGMYRVKAELEDLSFRYLEPEKYKELKYRITQQRATQEEDINRMEEKLSELLEKNNVSNYSIKGRIKNIYSVHKKMEQKNLDFNEIYDLMA